MAKKAVLAIGIDPALADPNLLRGATPVEVRNYVDAQMEALRALGYEVTMCLTDMGDSAEEVTARALRSKRFDCVLIGAGLREPAPQLLLFERIINLVHALAPVARICFNTTPADTVQAVQRWVMP